MERIPRPIAAMLLALAFASSSPQSDGAEYSPPGSNAAWRRYESANFELFSSVSDPLSRELLHQLELLRHVVLENTELQERRPTPVTVYYFRHDEDFRPYLPKEFANPDRIGGLYLSQSDRAVILLPLAAQDDESGNVIYHEYVHHLMRVTEQNPPVWYNEGMAELFSTFQVRPGSLLIGKAPAGRVLELQRTALLPLEQLLSATETSALYRGSRHTGTLYAQSWALVHFCYLGVSKIPRENLRQFLRLARNPAIGNNPARINELSLQQLGIDLEELNREIGRYIQGGRYQALRLDLPSIPERSSYRSESVPATIASLRLAELMVRTNRDPWAKIHLAQAVRDGSEDPRLQEVLGALAFVERDPRSAREHWDQALALGSANGALFHQLAQIESENLFRQYDPYFRLPAATADRLRLLLARSIDRAPNQSAAYEMLAWVEASSEKPDFANLNLVQSQFPRLNDRPRTLLAIATARWRTGDTPGAQKLVEPLLSPAVSPWTRHGAQILQTVMTKSPPR